MRFTGTDKAGDQYTVDITPKPPKAAIRIKGGGKDDTHQLYDLKPSGAGKLTGKVQTPFTDHDVVLYLGKAAVTIAIKGWASNTTTTHQIDPVERAALAELFHQFA